MGIVAARHVMLDTEEDKKKPTTPLELKSSSPNRGFPSCNFHFIFVSRPGPRNPLWLFMAAYASLGLRLTKFDFNVGSSDMLRSGVGRAPLGFV